MKLIKIISGTYGHKVGGTITAKSASDPPFELEDSAAARLVTLKVAQYAGRDEVADNLPYNSEGNADPGLQDGRQPYDETMKLELLKTIARDSYGLSDEAIKSLRSKKEVISAIDAVLASGAGDDDDMGADTNGEAPPDVTPAPPV